MRGRLRGAVLRPQWFARNLSTRKSKARPMQPLHQLSDAPPEARVTPFELPDDREGAKCLNVSIVGPPNAGKSVLLNYLVGAKVSAVSPKMNTTRHKMLGVLTDTESKTQLVFYDTPGFILQDGKHYQRELVTDAVDTLPSVDLNLLVVDAARRLDQNHKRMLYKLSEYAAKAKTPTVLVLNKVDRITDKYELLPLADEIRGMVDKLEKAAGIPEEALLLPARDWDTEEGSTEDEEEDFEEDAQDSELSIDGEDDEDEKTHDEEGVEVSNTEGQEHMNEVDEKSEEEKKAEYDALMAKEIEFLSGFDEEIGKVLEEIEELREKRGRKRKSNRAESPIFQEVMNMFDEDSKEKSKDGEVQLFEEGEEPTWLHQEFAKDQEEMQGMYAVYMVSALKDDGVDDLKAHLLRFASKASAEGGGWEYHSGWTTDASPMERVEECIREQIYRRYNKELPYQVQQINAGWTELQDGSLRIDQELQVPSDSHKGIMLSRDRVTGEPGLRQVSDRAKVHIENFLNRKVRLHLRIKVKKKLRYRR